MTIHSSKLVVELLELRSLPNSFDQLWSTVIPFGVISEIGIFSEGTATGLISGTELSSHDETTDARPDHRFYRRHNEHLIERSRIGATSMYESLTLTQKFQSINLPREDDNRGGFVAGTTVYENYPGTPYQFIGHIYSGQYVDRDNYMVGAQPWATFTDPERITDGEITGCGSGLFLSVLTASFPTWTFTCSENTLAGASLEVRTYHAMGAVGYVGADFQVNYHERSGNPINILWIQVVTTNHPLGSPHSSFASSYVDVPAGATEPFYVAANSREMGDAPNRHDGNEAHSWWAELHVVKQTGATSATIWGGLYWGWCNVSNPDPVNRCGTSA